jgi:hypothetical protein
MFVHLFPPLVFMNICRRRRIPQRMLHPAANVFLCPATIPTPPHSAGFIFRRFCVLCLPWRLARARFVRPVSAFATICRRPRRAMRNISTEFAVMRGIPRENAHRACSKKGILFFEQVLQPQKA